MKLSIGLVIIGCIPSGTFGMTTSTTLALSTAASQNNTCAVYEDRLSSIDKKNQKLLEESLNLRSRLVIIEKQKTVLPSPALSQAENQIVDCKTILEDVKKSRDEIQARAKDLPQEKFFEQANSIEKKLKKVAGIIAVLETRIQMIYATLRPKAKL